MGEGGSADRRPYFNALGPRAAFERPGRRPKQAEFTSAVKRGGRRASPASVQRVRSRCAVELLQIPAKSEIILPAPSCFYLPASPVRQALTGRQGELPKRRLAGTGCKAWSARQALFWLRTQSRCALLRPPAVANSCPACAGQSCQRMRFPDFWGRDGWSGGDFRSEYPRSPELRDVF